MNIQQELFFEIRDRGNYLKLTPLHRIEYNSELDWDKNWIETKVEIKGGCFSGEYNAQFTSVELLAFLKELELLYENLNNNFVFEDLESWLKVEIIGDGIGHFHVEVAACDQPGYGAQLNFEMSFDQTQIQALVNQLEKITLNFPKIGSL